MIKKTQKVTGKKQTDVVSKIVADNLKGFAKQGARASSKCNIPTGHFNLDFALHFGDLPENKDLTTLEGYDPAKTLGFPLGKVAEIFGDEGSGKSSICYRIVGYAQKMGLKCMWFDVEQSFAENLAVTNGVNLDDLWLSEKPGYAEDIFNNIFATIESGEIKVIIIDSVAGLVPKEQMEGSAEDKQMAALARVMSSNVPRVVNLAGQYGVLVIFINQIRQKVGSNYGPSDTTPGGNALKFYSSIRLRFTRRTAANQAIFIVDPDNPSRRKYIGHYSGLKIEKDRFAKPLVDQDGSRVTMDIPLYFEPYCPNVEDIAFDAGRQLKIISVRKGVFTWNDLKIEGQGNFIKALSGDESLVVKLIEEIKEKAKQEKVHVPPEIAKFDPTVERIKRLKVSDDDKEAKTTIEKKRLDDGYSNDVSVADAFSRDGETEDSGGSEEVSPE